MWLGDIGSDINAVAFRDGGGNTIPKFPGIHYGFRSAGGVQGDLAVLDFAIAVGAQSGAAVLHNPQQNGGKAKNIGIVGISPHLIGIGFGTDGNCVGLTVAVHIPCNRIGNNQISDAHFIGIGCDALPAAVFRNPIKFIDFRSAVLPGHPEAYETIIRNNE